ncbi:dienelactone hydrolase family protein [Streptomyces specialis]|uniref:dienelactone hydrolase family protein n=1 Tax=Streptomyces specialis TaxID=498367 RepID=UPI00073E5F1E|nr:dienelactone hydrolase family protein [Streptomyces specialis]
MRHRPRGRRLSARLRFALTGVLAASALLGAGTLPALSGTAAAAGEQEYRRGPDPTLASLQAQEGPFAYATVTVPDQATYDGGTIYYPTDTSQGTFGAIAISPGYTGYQNSIAWYGRLLASNGFVVFTIDVENTNYDQPNARGEQLLDALDYLTQTSSVRSRIDPNRLAVAGHSMGGGGALRASYLRPSLQASIPLTPYHTWKNWSWVTVPTMIFGAENDTVTEVEDHAEPFYNTLTSAQERFYIELNAPADHLTPTSYDPTIGQYPRAFAKRYIDTDTRYEQFLCPPPAPSSAVEESRRACLGS